MACDALVCCGKPGVHCAVICLSCLTSIYPPLPSPCHRPSALALSKPRPWGCPDHPVHQSALRKTLDLLFFVFFNIQCDHRLGTPIEDVCAMTQFMLLVWFTHPTPFWPLLHTAASIHRWLSDKIRAFRLSSLKIEHRSGTPRNCGCPVQTSWEVQSYYVTDVFWKTPTSGKHTHSFSFYEDFPGFWPCCRECCDNRLRALFDSAA